MARRKPNNLIPIKDIDAANGALAEIAAMKRSIADIERELNDGIDRLKAEAEADAAPMHVRLSAIENGLLAFAEFNKDELFKDKRSKDLDFGSLGYRKSKELKTQSKWTWAMVLGKIKEMDFKEGIRVKESVDKDELQKWPDERLEIVGVRRVPKDTFWYEIDEHKIADKAA